MFTAITIAAWVHNHTKMPLDTPGKNLMLLTCGISTVQDPLIIWNLL